MNNYNTDILEHFIEKCKRKETLHYRETDPFLYDALTKYNIAGHNTLIIGSTEPCYEALAFLNKVNSVTLVEYRAITTDFPNFKTMTVTEFENDNTIYDSAISISSIEHTGLGRYGDPIDPDGDLKALSQHKDRIKPSGLCFLAVPIGNDRVEGNLHRVYGKDRLPKLLKGWKILDKFGFDQTIFESNTQRNQPVFVLEKL